MTQRHLRFCSALFAMLLATACNGDDDPTVMIVSPSNDSVFSLADDVDAALDGVQIDVDVSVQGEGEGTEVWLFTDASRLLTDPMAEPDLTGVLDAEGNVRFQPTLVPGAQDLLACVGECQYRSVQVRVRLNDSCAGVAFIDPEPGAGSITLGGADDVDGEACGVEFATNVRVVTTASEGATLQLFVNGTPGPTASPVSGQVRFDDVVLGNRGATPNQLTVVVTETDGATCSQPFDGDVFVDCEGTSCAITLPDSERTVLNSMDDVSAAPGFQADFEVTADLEASGQRVNLIVDGAVLTATSMTSGGASLAEFSAIDLSEGRHTVVAECFDELGNLTRTAPAEWTVDTVGCELTVAEPVADTLYVSADDIDSTTPGLQIQTSGTVAGVGCVGVTAGTCGGAGDALTLGGTSFSGAATLSNTPTQEFCVVVTDDAGNETEARIPLRVRTDEPQLEITSPADGTSFNELGTGGATADLDPATPFCDIELTVLCSEAGETVEIVDADTGEVYSSTTCVADAGAAAPFTASASPTLAIPSFNDGATLTLVARQEVDRLVGTSSPITLTPDCSEPLLTISDPMCGSILRPSEDDQDPGTPGFQYGVFVLNRTSNLADETTLTIVDDMGAMVDTIVSSTRPGGGQSIRLDADFGAGGELTMRACATDAAGNVGCTMDCPLTILELPALAITEPASMASLGADDDCDPGTPGMQVRVRATTDAADSTPATITVGALAPVAVSISGGEIDACVDAEQGSDVAIRVTLSAGAGDATATVRVDIDSMPPTDAISDLAIASVVDRRGGVVRLQYTAVGDTDGTRLENSEIRCARSPITNDTEWADADVWWTATAASPGSIVAADVPGFLVGVEYYCVARSTDLGGGLTPLPAASLPVATNFLSQSFELGTGAQLGENIRSIGDVDGDTLDDFLIGGETEAYIVFGRTTLTPGTPIAPDIVIEGGASFAGGTFGSIAAIGDFNGDSRDDFAIGAGQGDSVYVFFGRASRADWSSATLTVGPTQCPGSAQVLCIRGVAGSFLGAHIASVGDFDGDGIDDLGIGALAADGLKGTAYVIKGSATFTASASVSVSSLDGFEVASTSAPAQQFIGAALVSLGDLTTDGRADLFVSGSGAGSVQGRVRRVDGRAHSGTPGLDQIEWDTLTEIDSGAPGRFGVSVVSLGDLDQGGTRDLGVYVSGNGAIQVYTGETGFTLGFSFTNDLASPTNDRFGFRPTGGFHPTRGLVGQIDGLTGPEALLGSEQNGTGPGDSRLWYSPRAMNTPRSTAEVVFVPALAGGEATGRSVAGFVGDINGDGHNDLAVGEPDWPTGTDATTTPGRVTVYY